MAQILKLSNAGEKLPRCRICEGLMPRYYDEARKIIFYACLTDQWRIATTDIFLRPGAWDRWEQDLRLAEDTKELWDCPNCRAAMRGVCTSTGYMLFKCVKRGVRGCGMKVELKEPDRVKPGEVGVGVKDLVLDLTEEEKRKFS